MILSPAQLARIQGLLRQLAAIDPERFPNEHILSVDHGAWTITHPLWDRIEYDRLADCPITNAISSTEYAWAIYEERGEWSGPVTLEAIEAWEMEEE